MREKDKTHFTSSVQVSTSNSVVITHRPKLRKLKLQTCTESIFHDRKKREKVMEKVQKTFE